MKHVLNKKTIFNKMVQNIMKTTYSEFCNTTAVTFQYAPSECVTRDLLYKKYNMK